MNAAVEADAGAAHILPRVALWMTALGLAISMALAAGVGMSVIHVAWNAELLPRATLFGLVPFSVAGLIVSIVAWRRHRTTRTVVAIVMGVAAVLAAVVAWLTIIGTAIAAHPV